jgi:hypothetical protein
MSKGKIIAIVISLCGFNAAAQIPNFSFEIWNNAGNYEDPDQWGTLNGMTNPKGAYTCEKGTPGNPGASYIMLTSRNITGFGIVPGMAATGTIDTASYSVTGGFPFTQRPQSLTGNWQYMPFSGTDFGFISVYLTKWNSSINVRDTISQTEIPLLGMVMGWSNFSIFLSYQSGDFPDSAQIILSASGQISPSDGDYLYIDNLSFSGNVAGISDNAALISGIYPNPSSGELTILFYDSEKKKVEIINALGEPVCEFVTNKEKVEIDLSNHPQGIYFVILSNENETVTRKIVKR